VAAGFSHRVTGVERLSSSMDERPKQIKRIICVAIVTAAAVTLGLSVQHDLQFTSKVTVPTFIEDQKAALRQEECIYHAIRSQVPKGATVYVDGRYATVQRVSELSTLWAVPQASLATAQWQLSLVPARGHCGGLALEVRRL
jgi:hypothetical protein